MNQDSLCLTLRIYIFNKYINNKRIQMAEIQSVAVKEARFFNLQTWFQRLGEKSWAVDEQRSLVSKHRSDRLRGVGFQQSESYTGKSGCVKVPWEQAGGRVEG